MKPARSLFLAFLANMLITPMVEAQPEEETAISETEPAGEEREPLVAPPPPAASEAPQLQMQCRQLVCLCADPVSSPAAQARTTMSSMASAARPVPPPAVSSNHEQPPPVDEEPTPEEEEEEEVVEETPEWHESPQPFAGFLLNRRQFGVSLEAGYPFFDFHLDYGVGRLAQIIAGYRGLYSLSNAGYAGVKFQLFRNSENTVSLSLTALMGYTGIRSDYAHIVSLVGGDSVFGELHFNSSIRRGRHTLFIIAGVRVSHVRGQDCDDEDSRGCWNHPFNGDDGAFAIGFAELGYGVRVMRYATFFFGLGADLFINGNALPALPRGRIGLVFDF